MLRYSQSMVACCPINLQRSNWDSSRLHTEWQIGTVRHFCSEHIKCLAFIWQYSKPLTRFASRYFCWTQWHVKVHVLNLDNFLALSFLSDADTMIIFFAPISHLSKQEFTKSRHSLETPELPVSTILSCASYGALKILLQIFIANVFFSQCFVFL